MSHANRSTVKLRIRYGGKFVLDRKGNVDYVGGGVKLDMDDGRYLTFDYLEDLLRKEMKCPKPSYFWFRKYRCSLKTGRQRIESTCDLMNYEVEINGDRYIVDLEAKTCDCRKWALCGIPCVHAYACITKKRLDHQLFVHKAYSKALYVAAYSNPIHPVPGPKQWENTPYAQPLPPPFRKMPGRPNTKKRKKDASETNNSRTVKKRLAICTNCGLQGHYVKSCKNVGVPKRPKQKGTRQVTGTVGCDEMPSSSSQPQPSQDGVGATTDGAAI